MTRTQPVWRRRALLLGGLLAVAGWMKGVPLLLTGFDAELEFEPIPGLAPFRRLTGTGAATSGTALLTGLEGTAPRSATEEALIETVRADPCTAFFGANRSGPVPVAMFSDFRCPVCRVMNERLDEVAASKPDSFRIVRHELPILGGASNKASQAVLAADRQGGYERMHARLIRSPAITDEAYIARVAADVGLDAERLLTDMNSDAVARQILRSKAIAEVFGFYGTPAFAIGRTVFLGGISTTTLEHLIAEAVENPCQTA